MVVKYLDRHLNSLMLVLLLAVCMPSVSANPTIEIEQTYYNYGEQVFFTACSDSIVDLNASVDCLILSNIISDYWETNCRIYAFDTEGLVCFNPKITLVDQDGRLEKNIFINNYREALEESINKSTVNDLQNISLNAYANYLLGDQDKIDEMLQLLKKKRNEDEKCWPSNDCSIVSTVEVLFYLSRAGVNRSKRVYHDALYWVESKQHESKGEDWRMTVEADENATCSVMQGATTVETWIMDGNETLSIVFDYTAGKDLNTTCDDDFCVDMENEFGTGVFERCDDGNDTVEFNMASGCWSITENRTSCDARLTAKALLIDDIDADMLSAGESWLNSNIVKTEITGEKVQTTQNILTNLYVYNVTADEDVKTWILYSQGNNGSFGDDNHTTLEAIRAFQSILGEEWVVDAINWIKSGRPKNGWNDILLNTITYELFGSGPSLIIRSDPLIFNSSETRLDFELYTSTPANLSFNLSSDLEEIVSVNYSQETNKGFITLKAKEDGIYKGIITFYNSSYSKDIPFIITKNPSVTFDFKPVYNIFNNTGYISIPITKSDSKITCDFRFDSIFDDMSLDITEDILKLNYAIPEDISETVTLAYNCSSELATADPISDEVEFSVRKFSSPPFTYELDNDDIDEDPATLTLTNLLNETVLFELSWSTETYLYPVQDFITLKPGQDAEIYIYQSEPTDDNHTEENELMVTALGFGVSIPITIYLDETVHEVESPYKISEGITLFTIIILSTIILIIGITAFFFIRSKKKLKNKRLKEQRAAEREEKKHQKGHKKAHKKHEDHDKKKEDDKKEGKENHDDKKHEIKEKEPKVQKKASALLEVLLAVDQKIGETPKEITNELKDQGYKKGVVKKTFKMLNKDIKKSEKWAEEQRKIEEAKKEEGKQDEGATAEENPEKAKEESTEKKPETTEEKKEDSTDKKEEQKPAQDSKEEKKE